MTQLAGATFISKWTERFGDNITREISEADLREFVQDIEDSFINIEDFEAPSASFGGLTGEPTDSTKLTQYGNGLVSSVRGSVGVSFNNLKKIYDALVNGDFYTDGTNFYLQGFAGVNLLLNGTNAYTKTLSLPYTAYSTSDRFTISVSNTNTGPSTLNLNSLGAKNIYKNHNQPLAAGDLKAGQIYWVGYDGTNFQIISDNRSINGGTP